jgi:hypothetical protein
MLRCGKDATKTDGRFHYCDGCAPDDVRPIVVDEP